MSAKAQELMTKYALDRVLVDADTVVPDLPGATPPVSGSCWKRPPRPPSRNRLSRNDCCQSWPHIRSQSTLLSTPCFHRPESRDHNPQRRRLGRRPNGRRPRPPRPGTVMTTIPVARLQAMREGGRRARARRNGGRLRPRPDAG
ncbi:hypothetical protein [Nocardia tengchongensis]|uniref:hypothetical protein n=1 Tax=Nocardia tengchongensis TaxID=2055889 RepID=UPI0036681118